MIKIESGKWTVKWIAKKASTVFAADSLVSLDDGYVTPADSTTGAADEQALGVYLGKAIGATTTGKFLYSNTAKIPVAIPIGPATIRATVTGTFAATNRGDGFDMSTALIVDADANTYKVVNCVEYISATEGIFMISKSLDSGVA